MIWLPGYLFLAKTELHLPALLRLYQRSPNALAEKTQPCPKVSKALRNMAKWVKTEGRVPFLRRLPYHLFKRLT